MLRRFAMLSYEKTKLKCLEICYSCIDRDISEKRFVNYETSFEQVFLYDYPKCTDIEKALWCFTLISRFARSGMLTNPNGILEGETRKNLEMIKSIPSEERALIPSQFFDDAEEAEQYINWLDRSRENE